MARLLCSFLVFFTVSGCSLFGLLSDDKKETVPSVQTVEVDTVAKEAPIYHPSLPYPIAVKSVEWKVLTMPVMTSLIQQSKESSEKSVVYYALDDISYKNMELHYIDVDRYIKELIEILNFYQKEIAVKSSPDHTVQHKAKGNTSP